MSDMKVLKQGTKVYEQVVDAVSRMISAVQEQFVMEPFVTAVRCEVSCVRSISRNIDVRYLVSKPSDDYNDTKYFTPEDEEDTEYVPDIYTMTLSGETGEWLSSFRSNLILESLYRVIEVVSHQEITFSRVYFDIPFSQFVDITRVFAISDPEEKGSYMLFLQCDGALIDRYNFINTMREYCPPYDLELATDWDQIVGIIKKIKLLSKGEPTSSNKKEIRKLVEDLDALGLKYSVK